MKKLLLGIFLLLFSSMGTGLSQTTTDREKPLILIVGTLAPGGIECPLFLGEDGKTYTLLGNLEGFKEGDRVKITAEPVEMSFCMQGITVAIKSVEKVGS